MKKLLLPVFAAIIFAGCAKEPTATPKAPVCETGTLQFVNNSNHPYNVYVNGSFEFQQAGNTSREQDFTNGSYVIKVEQESGYLVYPTIKEYSGNLPGCGKVVVSYP